MLSSAETQPRPIQVPKGAKTDPQPDHAAVLEVEPDLLNWRVEAAEAAIRGRLENLRYDSDQHEERHLMDDAQRSYRFYVAALKRLGGHYGFLAFSG